MGRTFLVVLVIVAAGTAGALLRADGDPVVVVVAASVASVAGVLNWTMFRRRRARERAGDR